MANRNETKPVFYTGLQAAEKLKLSPKTLRKYVAQGICPVMPLPGFKPPRWRASDVDAYVAGLAV